MHLLCWMACDCVLYIRKSKAHTQYHFIRKHDQFSYRRKWKQPEDDVNKMPMIRRMAAAKKKIIATKRKSQRSNGKKKIIPKKTKRRYREEEEKRTHKIISFKTNNRYTRRKNLLAFTIQKHWAKIYSKLRSHSNAFLHYNDFSSISILLHQVKHFDICIMAASTCET